MENKLEFINEEELQNTNGGIGCAVLVIGGLCLIAFCGGALEGCA